MGQKLLYTCLLSLNLCFVAPCSASVIIATGAGSTLATAQDLTADTPTEIVGTLDGVNQNDASMFKFTLQSPENFFAYTQLPGAFGIPDTVLSLFDSSGAGIFLNDDFSGGNTMSCLSSAGSGGPCLVSGPLLSAGTYYLAISRSANYPVDGSNNEIFAPASSTDLATASSTNPVAGWDGGAFTSPDFDLVNYDIVFSGTEVPEPASWTLLSGALLTLGALLRSQRKLHS